MSDISECVCVCVCVPMHMRVCAVLEAYDARVHAWVYGRERERAHVTVFVRVCVSASRGAPFAPAPRRMPPTRATGTCARGRW